jgi:hypothetical protein
VPPVDGPGSGDPSVVDFPSSTAPTESSDIERISVPLKDGRVSLDNMREATKDKLRAALDKTGGLSSGSSSSISIPPIVVPAICQALSALATVALMRVTGAPLDIVTPIAVFTPEDQAILKDPMLQVLDKYLSSSLDKYGAEVALLMAVYAIGQQKFIRVKMAMEPATPKSVAS